MEVKTSIHPLIVINNDRYEGYKTAAQEAREEDLQSMFLRFSLQSKEFADELRKLASENGEEMEKTTASGKLYRVWMDIKSALTGHDRKAILSSCEFGEDSAIKTYDEVLEEAENIPVETLTVIRRQRSELQKSHDEVKALRDRA